MSVVTIYINKKKQKRKRRTNKKNDTTAKRRSCTNGTCILITKRKPNYIEDKRLMNSISSAKRTLECLGTKICNIEKKKEK